MKKLLSIVLALVLVLSFAAVAESDETYANGLSKTEEVTITVSQVDAGNGTSQIEKAKEVFEALYPNVHVELLISTDIQNIVRTMVASKDDEKIPTVIDFGDTS